MRYTLYTLIAVLLFACNSNQTQEQIEIVENNTGSVITKATWLLGAWQSEMEDVNMIESWIQQNDSLMVGNAVFIHDGDTASSESLVIKVIGQDMFYYPTISNQNDGKAIEFKLTIATDTSLVFENPAHDFPQKITYIKHSEQKLTAEVSGTMDGKIEKYAFEMNKVQ